MHPAAALYAEHVNPAFVKLLGTLGYGRVFERAKGTRMWDVEGREYLDFLAGFGVHNIGHAHPRLVELLLGALVDGTPGVVHVGPQRWAGELGAELARHVPELPRVVLAQSGGEAVEAALKIARMATGRAGFVYCDGGFHGTGFGALSIMGKARMRGPFEPLLEGTEAVPFGDAGALDKALSGRRHAAFVVEPVQAEGGVMVPPPAYLREAARLCRRAGTLLIVDEVQTGLGRTGSFFAHRASDVQPDVVVLGKALGGGFLPVSAALVGTALHDRVFGSMETFDLCSTTFSGYSLGCRAAIETLRIVEDEGLCDRAARLGDRLRDGLSERVGRHPFVRGVRGAGLLVGIELGPTGEGLLSRVLPGVVDKVSEKVFGQWLALRLLEQGIVAQPASQQWNVLRLEPPLTVTEEEIDRVVDAVGEILGEYQTLRPLLADVGKRLGKQLTTGRRFG